MVALLVIMDKENKLYLLTAERYHTVDGWLHVLSLTKHTYIQHVIYMCIKSHMIECRDNTSNVNCFTRSNTVELVTLNDLLLKKYQRK